MQDTNEAPATNVIVHQKGRERYVFVFDDAHAHEAIRRFARFALEPKLSFTWDDADRLSGEVRKLLERE